jgi:hypothetical protein
MFRSTSLNMALEYQGDDHVLAGTLPYLASLYSSGAVWRIKFMIRAASNIGYF